MARFDSLTKGSCIDVQSLRICKRLCHGRRLEDVPFVKTVRCSKVVTMRVPCRVVRSLAKTWIPPVCLSRRVGAK